MAKLPYALFFLNLFTQNVMCGIAVGVIATGTTVGPGYSRIEGKRSRQCPSSHPYNINNHQSCCRYLSTVNETSCGGPKVNFMSTVECCQEHVDCDKPLCLDHKDYNCHGYPTVTIHSSGISYQSNTRYTIDKIFVNECDDHGAENYLLAQTNALNYEFVLDLSCVVPIKGFEIKQTHNENYNNGGTKDFSIESSTDLDTWTMLLEEVLPSAANLGCNVPVQYYTVDNAFGRYVRVTLKTYYVDIAGLQYFRVVY